MNEMYNASIPVAAGIIGLSVSTVTRWINKHAARLQELGIVDLAQIGFRRRIRILDMERFVNFMRDMGAQIDINNGRN